MRWRSRPARLPAFRFHVSSLSPDWGGWWRSVWHFAWKRAGRFCAPAAFSQAAHTVSMAPPVLPFEASWRSRVGLAGIANLANPFRALADSVTKCPPRFTHRAGRKPDAVSNCGKDQWLCGAPGFARKLRRGKQVGLARCAGRSGRVFRLSGFKFHPSALIGVVGGEVSGISRGKGHV